MKRAKLTRLLVLAFVLLLTGGSAWAQSDSDKAIWIANAAHRITSSDKWEYLDYWKLILDIQKSTNAPPIGSISALLHNKALADDIADSTSAVPNGSFVLPEVARANRIYDDFRQAGPLAAYVGDYLKDMLKEYTQYKTLEGFILANRSRSNSFHADSTQTLNVLNDIYELGKRYPEFKNNFNEVFGRFFRADIGDSADKIFHNNPDFATLEYVRPLAAQNGTILTNVDSLRDSVLAGMAGMADQNEQLREFNVKLKAFSKAQDKQANEFAALRERLDARAALERAEKEQQLKIDGLKSGTYILATLLPKTDDSRRFIASVNAVIELRAAVQQLEKNQQLASDQASEVAAASVFTGNLLLIGVSLVNAYQVGHQQPPEHPIMEALIALSRQLEEYQKENRERFDRLDAATNAIYKQAVQGFNEVLGKLWQVGNDLDSTRVSLDLLSRRMDLFEREVVQRLDFLIDQRFRAKMQECLDYQALSGEELTYNKYIECVSAIRAYLLDATQPPQSGEWRDELNNNLALAKALEGDHWAENINTFREMAARYEHFSLDGRRPNPLRWATAVRLYIALAASNTAYFQQAPLDFFREIEAEGTATVKDFSFEMVRNNPDKVIKLYRDLLQRYVNAVQKFSSSAARSRESALHRLGVPLHDITSHLQGIAVPDELAKSIRRTSINHISANAKGFPALPPLATFSHGVVSQLTGDASWPPILNGDRVWDLVLRRAEFTDLWLLGMGTLKLGYAAFFDKAQASTGSHQDWAHGMPCIQYFVYLAKDETEKLVGWTDELCSMQVKFFAAPMMPAYEASYGANDLFDFRKYVQNVPTPFGLPLDNAAKSTPAIRPEHPAPVPQERTTDPHTFSYDPNDGKTLTRFFVGPEMLNERDISARRQNVMQGLRAELANDLLSNARELGSALEEVNGTVLALRALTNFLFPESLTTDEELRRLLYGCSGTSSTSPKRCPALLNKESAAQLIGEPIAQVDDVSLFVDMKPFEIDAPDLVIKRIDAAIDRSKKRLEVMPLVQTGLAKLTDLGHLREVLDTAQH